MELKFNPVKAYPLGTLAVSLKLNKQVKLVPSKDSNEIKVARILAFNTAFYPLDAFKKAKIDAVLTTSAPETPNDFLYLAKTINEKLHEEILLSDYLLWGYLKSYSLIKTGAPNSAAFKNYENWFNEMDAKEECKTAVEKIRAFLPKTESVNVDAQIFEDPLYEIKKSIASSISGTLGFSVDQIINSLDLPSSKTAKYDLVIPLPKLRIKNPAEFATEVASKIHSDIFKCEAYETFLGFVLPASYIAKIVVPSVYKSPKYGTNKSGEGKFYVCEFSSPNIAKPFHAGHLRGTIIGNFIKNVCVANGVKCHTINYLGDWGKQYGLLAVGYKKYGSEEKLKENPIHHLFDIYVQINKDLETNPGLHEDSRLYFKRMEEGDEEALSLWKRFRDLSIVKYKEMYARLNVEFDEYSGESQFSDAMVDMLQHLESKGLLKEDKGAKIVDLTEFKLTPALIQKSDGATLYITRDLAAAYQRYKKHNFDKMFYVVGSQQELHFKQLFKVLKMAGYDFADNCEHIQFGLIRGMSTRKGTVKFLEDILDAAKEKMHEVMQKSDKYKDISDPDKISDILGLSAVVVQDFAARRIKDYIFDLDRMTSFEGDTGPYLQYAHARICSIQRKYVESQGQVPLSFNVSHPKMKDLLMLVAQYPDLVKNLPKNGYEACRVVTYLFTLCRKISSALDEVYVMGQDKDVAAARFWVYWCARVVLGNGIRLLGLEPVERM